MTTPDAWRELIGRRCGLAVRDAQHDVLSDLVNARMVARGVACPATYYDLLQAERDSGGEWTELVDRLVSHETSFFRHAPSYELLRSEVIPRLRSRPHIGGNSLAACSAGCSTGEEAYSLAMTLMADDNVGGMFTVWGIDISRRAIELARRAQYRERAVAAVPRAYRDRYLRPLSEGAGRRYEVVPALRERVRFVVANLYSPGGMVLNYDLILCQNVLIYFAPSAVSQLVARLGARLNPGGYLLLGPGEAPGACPAGLELTNVGGVRALQRVGRTVEEVTP